MKILALDLDKYDKKFVVYLMTFPNGKQYCGYSGNIKRRWHSSNEYRTQVKVYRAIQKYGWENIHKEVLAAYPTKEEALQAEADFIEQHDLINKGYNQVPGGGDPPHGKQYITKAGLEKMRENGRRLARETWSNPEKAAYAKQRMREEDSKSRAKMSPQERKIKYGQHKIGKIPSNAKPIYQIDKETDEIIAEYPSSASAAKAIGLTQVESSNIRRTANGKGHIAYGYKWRWK